MAFTMSPVQALRARSAMTRLLPRCARRWKACPKARRIVAALDVKAGTVIGKCMGRHQASEFRKLLDEVERHVPADLDIHIVMDNHGTHKPKSGS
jgi:hypothetical protein